MSIPATAEVVNSSTLNLAARIAEFKVALERARSKELEKQSASDEGGRAASEPVVLSSRERRNKEQQEKEEAAQQKLANAKPDIILFTTAGHKLVLPSKDKPVTVEQLAELGQHQDDTIAADSRHWPGATARLASIEYPLKIRGKDKHVSPVRFNRVQREVDHKAGKRNIVLKARQVGITTYVAARFFLHTMLQPGTLSVQVAHDQQSAEEIFRIVHRFLENLPEAWRRSALKTSRANVRQIIFPKLDSEYRVESAADRCAGRGLTIQNLHCSEVARWPHDVAETLAALRAAVPPDGEIFLESTPSGAGGTFYEEWQSAPETGYVQHFFPWWWEESYERKLEIVNFTEEEHELMTKHGLNPGQIAFRREMRSQFRNRFLEEYAENAETCFLTSGNCMFDCEVLDKQVKAAPEYQEEAENGRLLTFLPPVTGKDYIIGVDPAGGGASGDYACAQVIERDKGNQCAELLARYSPAELGARVATLARKYNHALVAVERNGLGESVIQYLMMLEGYTHMYPVGERAGWVTTRATKPQMVAILDATLAASPGLFNSKRLLQDCRSFVRDDQGNCDAAAGAHDDTVMAMAIALIVRERVDGRDREWQKQAQREAA
jgi:Terminase RNaseH-like domain